MTPDDPQQAEIQHAVEYCRSRHVPPEPTPGGPLRLARVSRATMAALIVLGIGALGIVLALVSDWM